MARKAPGTAPRRRKAASASPVKRSASGHAVPKPLKALSPKYAARIRAAAKREGITVAQLRKRGSGAARGHAPPPSGKTESALRRERQTAKIEAWAMRQAIRWPGDADQTAADIVAGLMPHIRAKGMDYLRRLDALIAGMHDRYMKQTERVKGRRPSLGINLDDLSERDELPPETYGYH